MTTEALFIGLGVFVVQEVDLLGSTMQLDTRG